MADKYILDAQGNPKLADLFTWAEWFEKSMDERILRQTRLEPDVLVSTVFLGLDHRFSGKGDPLLWETLVFGGALDGEQQRYSSRAAADRGHDAIVDKVKTAGGPEEPHCPS